MRAQSWAIPWASAKFVCKMEEVFLDFLPLPELNLGPDTLICEGTFYVLRTSDVIAPGPFLSTIEWPDGSSGAKYVLSEPGDYRVLARNDCGEVADGLALARKWER